MAGRGVPGPALPEVLLRTVAERAEADAGTWFPEFGSRPPRVRPVWSQARSRCFVHRLDLDDGRVSRPVLLKVRHSDPALRKGERFPDRPALAPVRTVPDDVTARREYDGLAVIRAAVGDAARPERFGVIRPLAWFPDHAAIVTDFVQQPTLRQAVVVPLRRPPRRCGQIAAAPWENAGALLRLFHEQPSSLTLPPRAATRAEVTDLYAAFAEFLADRIGARPVLGELLVSGPGLLDAALPSELSLGTGHADFVPNNLFTTREGRVTLFDPLPMWRLPVVQDLATMSVALRVLPAQATTGSLSLPPGVVAACEAALLRGYFGDDPVPRAPLLAFQLLVLLDRWAASVSRRSRRSLVRGQLYAARRHLLSAHFERVALRLLREVEEAA